MSYCVNCGVELDRTAKRCPLCNTPVVNPKELIDALSPTPYPKQKGQVEQVKHTDLVILLSVILGSTAVACGLINFLIYNGSLWSLYIIGACIMLWVFFTPAIIYSRLPVYFSVFFDGLVVGIYCFLININHPGNGWFTGLAVPCIALATMLIVLFLFLTRNFRSSILSTALYVFSELGVFCVCLELFIHLFLSSTLRISWSGVVLCCCVCIDLVLITILTRTRLREAVRRRMHL